MCLQHAQTPTDTQIHKHTQTNSATSLILCRLDLFLLLLLLFVLLLLRSSSTVPAAIAAFSLQRRTELRHVSAFQARPPLKKNKNKVRHRKNPKKRSEPSPLRPAGHLLPLQYPDAERVPRGAMTQIFARQIFMREIFFIMHILNHDFKY